jgi:hypothetical protein
MKNTRYSRVTNLMAENREKFVSLLIFLNFNMLCGYNLLLTTFKIQINCKFYNIKIRNSSNIEKIFEKIPN